MLRNGIIAKPLKLLNQKPSFMKKGIFIVLFVITVQLSFSQNFNQLANYEFDTAESYKAEENNVLLCANYLFNNPADQAEMNRLISIQYIIKWMTGTTDHTFELDEKSMELTKGNDDLLGLYMAAMSKVVIENNQEKLTNEEIHNRSEEILVEYCSNPDNKMKPSKKIKKILKSKKS